MEKKIYCWHASFNSSFNYETFGGGFSQPSFIENVYKKLRYKSGINGYTLFIVDFFQGNARMYFSVDEKLYEMTNLMAYDYRDMKVIDADTRRETHNPRLLKVRDYISCVLINRNVGNINQRIQMGKSLAFLEINFNDAYISDFLVQCTLKELFETQYSDFSL